MRVVAVRGSHKQLVATAVATRGNGKQWKWSSIDLSVLAICYRVMAGFWQWEFRMLDKLSACYLIAVS